MSTAPADLRTHASDELAGERILRPRLYTRDDLTLLAGAAGSAAVVSWLLCTRLLAITSLFAASVVWFVAFLTIYRLALGATERPLAARDKVVAAAICTGGLVLLLPLATILVSTFVSGIERLDLAMITETLEFVGPTDAGGGLLDAIVGTLQQVALAIVMSVPLGLATAVLLNEVGGRLVRPVRLFVDAMSGVPSIVAGLFIYAVWVVGLGQGFSGFAGSLALSVLMLPSSTRTAEEVLRLVPSGLREASAALGAPEWRTTWSVVLPTARSGLVTAVILGVARAVGETAPLIMTSFGARALNLNPFEGAQASLPLTIYQLIGTPQETVRQIAWTGALLLITLVLALFVTARLLGGDPTRPRRRRRRAGKVRA